MYLHTNHRQLINDNFGINEEGNFASIEVKNQLENPNPLIPPLKFELLTVPIFFEWLLSLRKRNGEKPLIGSYNSHRAALYNLYRDYHVIMPVDIETELSNHFKGLKRQLAQDASNGNAPVKVGKDPLHFEIYRQLCMSFFEDESNESVFAHVFLILCWNLMCRAGNAVKIALNHMEWMSDALGIYFAHMKNDQMGERPRDPRHTYANPLHPEICPILSLGLYFMIFPSVFASPYSSEFGFMDSRGVMACRHKACLLRNSSKLVAGD